MTPNIKTTRCAKNPFCRRGERLARVLCFLCRNTHNLRPAVRVPGNQTRGKKQEEAATVAADSLAHRVDSVAASVKRRSHGPENHVFEIGVQVRSAHHNRQVYTRAVQEETKRVSSTMVHRIE